MANDQVNWQELNLGNDEATAEGTRALRFLAEQVQLAQNNQLLRPQLQNLFRAHGFELNANERDYQEMPHLVEEPENGIEQEMQDVESPQHRSSRSPRRDRRPLERPQQRREEGDHHRNTDNRRKRQRSSSSSRSPSPSRRRGRERGRERQRRRRSPSPSESPESSDSPGERRRSREPRRRHRVRPERAWRRARKFKEGGKNVTFLTYDGTYGQTDRVLSFIQQFDSAFGGEDFTESSKLRHVAMYLQKSARKWWASLKIVGKQPHTWKACRAEMMKQFLTANVKDDVFTAWRGLKLEKAETIHSYINKFWDLYLKASVFAEIPFQEQRQQYCAGLPDDVRSYINEREPTSISEVIHRSMVGIKIFNAGKSPFTRADKGEKDKGEKVPSKEPSQKTFTNDETKKKKRPYNGSNRKTAEELNQLRKENKCFRCKQEGHMSKDCPTKKTKQESPMVTHVQTHQEMASKATQLCFAWGKVRDQNSLILFDPGSTHNFISVELAQKLGIQTEEMGPVLEARGAFKGQEVPVTPLIGKLRLHVQNYVDQEEFYISPLSSEDVILGAPWFYRMAASLEFPSRTISFTYRGRDIILSTEDRGNTIPIVSHTSIQKSIKKSIFAYMIFASEPESLHKSKVESNELSDQTNFLSKYKDSFAGSLPDVLPPSRGDDDHRIDLIPGSAPPNKPPYRVSFAQQEEILTQVNELLEKGMIRPSSSPFCSPVLLVQKKDGSYRMCIDYRALNKHTIKNRFPVPRIEDIFDRLQGSSYFSRIDLKSGYHQIRIVPEDIHKTAFRTQFGLYEYVVMPFGLTNAPATFNRMMEKIFQKHRAFVGVFFDDIIIHSSTLEEHKAHLQTVFEELQAHKLYVNDKKSEFFMTEIKYLGHVISKEGIRMDPDKLQVINEWPVPRNLHELRSFIGMCSYYRRFIEKFSVIAGPLHDLTKKAMRFQWSARENEAFKELKARLMSQPLLVLPDLRKPFEVHCDASGNSLGGVLSQEGHPVAYESRRLHDHELHLGIYEKELLAVIHSLDAWKHYLIGTPFVIHTDHQSLRYFMTQTKLSEKQMRWANFLSQFHFQFAHVPGKLNPVADALSRRPRVNAVSIAFNHDLADMIEQYSGDEDFGPIYNDLVLGKPQDSYSLNEGFLLYGNRLCVTKALREKVLYESHSPPYAGHRGIQATTKAIETYFYWPHMRKDVHEYVSECIICQKVKFDRGKAPGLLQPLPIPDGPWQSISMDFIFGLPKSKQGNTGIWTIVDRFSKQAHFLPVKKTITAKHMAKLYMSNVFKHHGIPTSIVSDRDPRMTSLFWRGLFENLGTKLNFSSAYHPQTDGQSEILNSIVLDLLKNYIGEIGQRDQWEQYLPLVEFAYNNTVHTSTGKAPFEIIEGRAKLPLIIKPHEKIFAADEYVRDIAVAFDKVKDAIAKAQEKHKKAADKHRRPVAFKDDEWVLLRFTKARLSHTTGKNRQGQPTGHQKYYMKLAKRYYGPFQILKQINDTAYRLKLPVNWHIHNAFHVSLLKPFKGEPPSQPIQEEPPEFDEQDEILVPDEIIKHEENTLRSGKVIRRYLVRFKHYPMEDAQWMQETQLRDSSPLLNSYKHLYGLDG